MEVTKYPKTTFTQALSWLGREFDEQEVAALKKEYNMFNEIVADERGYVSWLIRKKNSEGVEEE